MTVKNEVNMKKFSNIKAWTVISIIICLVLSVLIWLIANYIDSPTGTDVTAAFVSHFGILRG